MNQSNIPLKADKVEFGALIYRCIGETFSPKGKRDPFVGVCISRAPICDDKSLTKNGGYRSYKVDVVNANTLRIERWDMRRCAIVADPNSTIYQQLAKFQDSETFKIIAQGRENRSFSDLNCSAS